MKNYKRNFFNINLLVLFMLTLLVSCSNLTSKINNPKRIMFFGDSNTWGWIPIKSLYPSSRFDLKHRWPGIVQAELALNTLIIEEALPGRNTCCIDPTVKMVKGVGVNGAKYLPAAIASHMPLDLVVIMLGTNDVKDQINLTSQKISENILKMASEASTNTGVVTTYTSPQILIVAPPPLGAVLGNFQKAFSASSKIKSRQLGKILESATKGTKFHFLDAGEVIKEVTGIDGVHMSLQDHKLLGSAVAKKIREILFP